MTVDWGKLGTLVIVLLSATLLAVTKTIPGESVVPLYTAVIGYTFGNGRLAVTGKSPQPMLSRKSGPAVTPARDEAAGDVDEDVPA